MKIEDLENVVRDLKKCFNVLAVVVSIVGLINVVMLALMLKDWQKRIVIVKVLMYEVSKIMNELSYLCSIRSSIVLVLFK